MPSNGALAGLSPDVLKAIVGLSGMDEEGALLQEQLAQALDMQRPSGQQYTTGWGAALGGLGDIVRGAAGGYQANQLRGQQKALVDQKGAARSSYADAILRALEQPAVPGAPSAGMSPMAPGMGALFMR